MLNKKKTLLLGLFLMIPFMGFSNLIEKFSVESNMIFNRCKCGAIKSAGAPCPVCKE